MSTEEIALGSVPEPVSERLTHDERKRVEKPVPGRLFFVRLPKPAELSSNDGLEAEKDSIDAKLRNLSDDIQPILAERSKAQAFLAETREVIRELKAQIDDKEMTLNPYQAEKKAAFQERESQRLGREEQRAADKKARDDSFRAELNAKQKIRNEFSSQYGHLGVSNDEEIDEKIKGLEFQQQHESMSINEEKAIIKQIKQLQDSREAVRSFAQWSAHDKAERDAKQAQKKRQAAEAESARTNRDKVPEKVMTEEERAQAQEMAALKADVNTLWEEYKAQLDLRSKQQAHESELREQADRLFEERDSLRRQREEVWEQIQAHRAKVRAANQPYSENRSFSNNVRELVKKGQLDEARQLCSQQTEELIAQFASDASFRKDYNRLWDAAVDYKRPAATASESHHKAAASVIAEALEAAKRSVASKTGKLKEAENRSLEAPLAAAGNGHATTEPATAPFAVSKPEIPGLDARQSRQKPKKEKKVKQNPVELPKLDDTEFVPPPTALRSTAGLTPEEQKAQEVAHNKAAAAEASMRKEKRKLAQEKKREQKRQRAELQSKVQPDDLPEEVVKPQTPPLEESLTKAGSEAENTSPPVDGTGRPRQRSTRPLSNGTARVGSAPKSRPFVRRKGFVPFLKSYARTAYSTAEDRPLVTGLITVSAIILAIAPVIYHFS